VDPITIQLQLRVSPRAGTAPDERYEQRRQVMLQWAIVFFVIALIAAFLGFGGIAGTAVGVAKVLFIGFLMVAAVMLIMGMAGARRL
jgi:uncharacterized membrane protein YtjA (UPF0391 family)